MAANWSLAPQGINAMEILNAAGNAQAQAQRAQAAQQEQARQRQIAQVSGDALNGDPRARAQLAYLDRDFFQALDKESRSRAKADLDTLGNYALLADTPEKWDGYVREYVQMGHPEAAQYIGKFSPQLRASIIGQANMAKDYLAQTEAKYMSVPEGGGLVNVRDPAAISAYQSNAQNPIVATQTGPAPGTQVDGWTFKGGNPNDRNNWTQGGAGAGPRSFP